MILQGIFLVGRRKVSGFCMAYQLRDPVQIQDPLYAGRVHSAWGTGLFVPGGGVVGIGARLSGESWTDLNVVIR
jgi:hypothetical protein